MPEAANTTSTPAPVPESPDAWLEQYGDLLFRTALVRVGDRSLAEDLVQEAFLAAWKNRDTFDGRSNRGTWLVAILRRKIADHFRKVGRMRETPTDEAEDIENALFDSHGLWRERPKEISLRVDGPLEHAEFWQVMRHCVSELPPTLSSAYCLREVDSQAPDLVCEELGISRQNLSVRLHRARLLLRRCLEGRWLGERSTE